MAVARLITFLVNGYSLADSLNNISVKAEQEELDASVLANSYRSYETGFKTGEIDASGFFDCDTTNADEIHDVFASIYNSGATNNITYSTTTPAVNGVAIMMNGCELKYNIGVPVGGLISVVSNFKATNGVGFGRWLMYAQLNAGTTTGTAVDNAAATTGGGLFQVHLQNVDASDVDVKLQHSTDNSTWGDVSGGAVNNLSALFTSGSVAVSGTINRYTRAVAVVTGGNTTLVGAAFARR